ncbi:ABC transporter permease [Clostridium sp. Marseille-P3244]|uniref:ABC transporter permease n=1 Tax=Clostridium sp. Marseille-P3244 TaxID=1871020 RepID=UPI00093156B8|nr:ABC transporter permease [Clostridium sp. Marseille-P3244]
MNFDFRQQPIKISSAILAIILGLIVGSIFIAFTGNNPIIVYGYMISGAFGSPSAIASTLRWTTPLLFAGLAATVAFRGGMFNFGVDGQLYMGAFAAALAGIYFEGLPMFLHILVCFGAAMISGCLWAVIPALIRVRLGGNEAIPAMMMNYIAMYLCDYLTQTFFLPEDTYGQTMATELISENARLEKIIPPYTVTYGFVIAVALIILAHFALKYTKAGFRVSMTGLNSEFSHYGGIQVDQIRWRAMLLSGAIAGLCGAAEVMGVTWRYESGFSPDFGIEGILASLLGGNEPFGLFLGALFMGAMKAGSLVVERSAEVPRALAEVIKAFIICFVSARYLSAYIGLDRLTETAKRAFYKIRKKGGDEPDAE